ncbi:MAG: polysaccharide biosynthesis C-terminal domain-containing protein [Microgenomates group bacterium]
MKIALIIVAIPESSKLAQKLARLIAKKRLGKLSTHIVVNRKGTEGYSHGVNKGLNLAKLDNPDLYIVANPDLVNVRLSKKLISQAVKHFDLWGYAFKQDGDIFYGGEIDRNRLTAGLSRDKKGNFSKTDFVSGSLMLFTRKTFKKLGFWSEQYHMYYEDVDYSQRAINAGLRVGVVSSVIYEHLEMSKANVDKDGQLMASWIRFFIKNAELRNWLYELIRLPKTLYEHYPLIFHQLKRRPFVYNFMTLNFSSLAIKILNFILFLFLVRFFTANQFGLYNLVWAQIGLFMPLADMGTTNYGIFHLKKGSTTEFSKLFSVRLVLSIFIAIVTLIYTYGVFRQPELLLLTALSTPVVLANAVSGSFLIYTTLIARTYLASLYSLFFNTFLIAVLIGLMVGRFGMRSLFLAEGILFGLYGLYLWLKTKQMMRLKIGIPKMSYLKNITRKSYMYILLSFFAGLYFKVDLLILQYFKGVHEVGVYASGYKFFEALIFVGSSYTIAATPIYKQHLEEDRPAVKKKIIRDSTLLFILGMGIAIFSWFSAPIILPFALGKEFVQGIWAFRVVIFALPFLLVSAVCMNVLYLLKKVKWVVAIFLFQIFVNIVGNVIFVPLFSYHASAIITVLCEMLNTAITVPLVIKAYENIG